MSGLDLQWAIVEVMGHKTFAGRIEEVEVCGAGMMRLDVPAVEGAPAFTKLLSPQSIYAINPTDEASARAAAERLRERPLDTYQLVAQPTTLRSLPSPRDDDYGEDDGPDDFDDDLESEPTGNPEVQF